MNVIRTMLEGRGSYPRRKTRMVALRRGKKLLQRDRLLGLNLNHYPDPMSNRVGSAKREGRGSRHSGRPKSACNGVKIGISDIHTNLSYLLLFCICLFDTKLPFRDECTSLPLYAASMSGVTRHVVKRVKY
jgi:hypothetical protein